MILLLMYDISPSILFVVRLGGFAQYYVTLCSEHLICKTQVLWKIDCNCQKGHKSLTCD